MATAPVADPRPSYGRRLTDLAERQGDSAAIVHAGPDAEEQVVSWRQLDERSNQLAHHLQSRGVGSGDWVVVGLPNVVDHFFATFAAWKLGATVLPLRWDLPPWERDRLLALAAPRITVAQWDGVALPVVTPLDIAASAENDRRGLPDRAPDPARAIASSGSTGLPKLIVTPVAGRFDATPPNPSASSLLATGGPGTQLVVSPLYHANGFASYNGLLRGDRAVVMERFDAGAAVGLIERYRVTTSIMVPTMLQRIAKLPSVGSRDFSSIQALLYGGGPLAPWVARAWFDLVGPEHFFFTYGGTESIGLTMCRGDDWLEHEGTVGKPVGCQVQILDDDDRRLRCGEVGTIFMRSLSDAPSFMYVGASPPRRTNAGFTTFGDLGWLDSDGYLYVSDRRADLVVSGGANVYPAEVELALLEHAAVDDVAVVGIPDDEWGQRVHAIVQPLDTTSPPALEDLVEHCRQRLAAYKVPKSFELTDALPRSAAGKLNRRALADERRPQHAGQAPRPPEHS